MKKAKAPAAEIDTRTAEEIIRERRAQAERENDILARQRAASAEAAHKTKLAELDDLLEQVGVEVREALERLRLAGYPHGILNQVVVRVERRLTWYMVPYSHLHYEEYASWYLTYISVAHTDLCLLSDGTFAWRAEADRKWKGEYTDDRGLDYVRVTLPVALADQAKVDVRITDVRRVLESIRRIGAPAPH